MVSPSQTSEQPAMRGNSRPVMVLTLPLNGVYFDQIKAGTKREEYRLNTSFWRRRLLFREFDRIVLTRGYPKASEAERRLILPWRGYEMKTIQHPHFGADPVRVFAIDVSGEPMQQTADDASGIASNPLPKGSQ